MLNNREPETATVAEKKEQTKTRLIINTSVTLHVQMTYIYEILMKVWRPHEIYNLLDYNRKERFYLDAKYRIDSGIWAFPID